MNFITSFLLMVTIILVIDFIIIWGLQGFSFKNFKTKLIDTTYWRKRSNTFENDLDLQRKVHAHNTIIWTGQLEELKIDYDDKKEKYKLAMQELKKAKERIKELEKK